jgi:hypothetical protein
MSDKILGAAPTRREWLSRYFNGIGSLAFAAMAAPELAQAAEALTKNPLAPKPPHFPGKSKSCIFMYMSGGVSQVDTFDYKPTLQKMAGKRMPLLPGVSGQIETLLKANNQVLPSPFEFAQFGQSGRHVNKLFEQLGPCVDDLAFLYGVKVDSNSHGASTMNVNTGSVFQGNPSVGAWVVYGLGTENQNVPGYIVLQDPRGGPMNGAAVWQSGYLPAAYQGTALRASGTPILDLASPPGLTRTKARQELDLLRWLNEQHAAKERGADDLEARIASYELAFRMQSEAMDLVNVDKEPEHIRKLYGLDDPIAAPFGRQCLMARRLVESGVRFVLLIHGYENGVQSWDQHNQLGEFLSQRVREVDRPVAGLVKDLKQRGMLRDTLVSWTSEMGRTPFAQGGGDIAKLGRNHNQYGMVSWMAGGGIQGGATAGQTDEFGLKGIGESLRVRDFHATVLHSLGLNDAALTYLHQGRFKRLTDTGGRLVKEILA